jgi:hypothetical protein
MRNPVANTKVWAWSAERIMDAYFKSGIPELRPDWRSDAWVKLFTAGWNSGAYSKRGVLKVAQYLHDNGIPVTLANVYKYGKAAGGTRNLQAEERPDKRDWQKRVAGLYYYMKNWPWQSTKEFMVPPSGGEYAKERAAEARKPKERGSGWLIVVLLAAWVLSER